MLSVASDFEAAFPVTSNAQKAIVYICVLGIF